MSTIEVIDNKNGGKVIKAKVDFEDSIRLKNYTYVVDNISERPYREEIVEGKVRRTFLVRDVMFFKFGDGRVVYSKNKDPFDCRRDNLEEGKVRNSVQRQGNGLYWPHTFKSLLNFLDIRKGVDEDLVHSFLSKAYEVKYSYKMISLTYNSNDYLEFQTKKVFLIIKRVLHKYFEWNGVINPIKDLTLDYKNLEQKEQKEQKKQKEQKEQKDDIISEVKEVVTTPIMVQRVFSDLREREKTQELANLVSYTQLKQDMITFIEYDTSNSLKILRDPKIFPLEHLLTVINERMPMALQFNSK